MELKREISVSTTSVVINTLVVGKKQFTIAMLKQLPFHPAQRDFCTSEQKVPVGNIWGVVRYCLSAHSPLWHLIIELNGRLYRFSGDEKDLVGIGIRPSNLEQLFIAV